MTTTPRSNPLTSALSAAHPRAAIGSEGTKRFSARSHHERGITMMATPRVQNCLTITMFPVEVGPSPRSCLDELIHEPAPILFSRSAGPWNQERRVFESRPTACVPLATSPWIRCGGKIGDAVLMGGARRARLDGVGNTL